VAILDRSWARLFRRLLRRWGKLGGLCGEGDARLDFLNRRQLCTFRVTQELELSIPGGEDRKNRLRVSDLVSQFQYLTVGFDAGDPDIDVHSTVVLRANPMQHSVGSFFQFSGLIFFPLLAKS